MPRQSPATLGAREQQVGIEPIGPGDVCLDLELFDIAARLHSRRHFGAARQTQIAIGLELQSERTLRKQASTAVEIELRRIDVKLVDA